MSKSKKIILVIAVILFIAVIGIFGLGYWFLTRTPDLSQYDYLLEPEITDMPDQKMIVAKVQGDPDQMGDVFSHVIQAYFMVPGIEKNKIPGVRGRWDYAEGNDTDNLTGEIGIPVPDSVSSLPPNVQGVELATWEYGEEAQILHIGPYKTETPTIERLKKFIEDQGYEITGTHEEDYLKGPTMFGPGNPEEYYTIIRYQIRKK
ncbi:GyrI-like domain-containing protein [Patescibacteria group bacterium]|nr:GyrI-like domain-containing protein [Patescibacteria group bacterium]MBU1673529.1 GyrI-like domain-containing protein [Patescibacteria group bacterium]MBU1963713.1 GyrI-like domain-containing protein [Patescibacteria group bacterium]